MQTIAKWTIWNTFTTWKRSKACTKTVEKCEICENHRWVPSFLCRFTWCRHTFPKQCKTVNSKRDRILTRFGTSSVWVYLLPLRDRDPCFSVLILWWLSVHFGVILHDFVHPSRSLFKVYEWPMKHFRKCNLHHFLKCFWHGKKRDRGDVWWISWKMKTKLYRQKVR